MTNSHFYLKRDNNILRHLCKDDDYGLVGRLHLGRGLLAGDTEECYSGALVVPAAQLGRPSTVGGTNAFLVPRVLILIPFHSHSGPAGANENQSPKSGLQP